MNRARLGIKGLARACLALGACLALLCSVAAATPDAPPATVQPERSWENYFGVAILPSGRTVVVGDKGVVMVTDNQGQTWTRRQLQKGPKYYDLYSVAFTADGSKGWLVGDSGVIFRSDDQGTSWNEQAAPAGATGALLKIALAGPQTACAGGEHGVIICTSDGGANWNLQKFGDICFFDLTFTDAQNGWAVGEFQTILHTGDGGKTWKILSGGDQMKAPDPYFAVAFGNPQDGLAVGLTGDATATSDGGKTWKPADLSIEHRSYYTVAAVPAHPDTFFAAGENGIGALIAGGQLSQLQTSTSNGITSAAFSDRFAMAVGLSGTLLLSSDGGQHWHSLNHQDEAFEDSGAVSGQ